MNQQQNLLKMKTNNNIVESTKKQMIENLLSSKIYKIFKYTSAALVVTYALGHVFKVLAFTNNNYTKFKNSLTKN